MLKVSMFLCNCLVLILDKNSARPIWERINKTKSYIKLSKSARCVMQSGFKIIKSGLYCYRLFHAIKIDGNHQANDLKVHLFTDRMERRNAYVYTCVIMRGMCVRIKMRNLKEAQNGAESSG